MAEAEEKKAAAKAANTETKGIYDTFNTQEKISTGVSQADLVQTNAIHMQTHLYSLTDSAKAIETSAPIREVLDKMIARQSILLKAAQKT